MPTKDSSALKCPSCSDTTIKVLSVRERPAEGFLRDRAMQVISTCECEKCGAVFSQIKASNDGHG
jgi:uncharacterized Zn finger protein